MDKELEEQFEKVFMASIFDSSNPVGNKLKIWIDSNFVFRKKLREQVWALRAKHKKHDHLLNENFDYTEYDVVESYNSALKHILSLLKPEEKESEHEHIWMDARNEVVKNGYFCRTCGELSLNHDAKESA